MPPQGRGNFAFVWLIAEHFCESIGGVTEFGQTSFSLGEAPGECGVLIAASASDPKIIFKYLNNPYLAQYCEITVNFSAK